MWPEFGLTESIRGTWPRALKQTVNAEMRQNSWSDVFIGSFVRGCEWAFSMRNRHFVEGIPFDDSADGGFWCVILGADSDGSGSDRVFNHAGGIGFDGGVPSCE